MARSPSWKEMKLETPATYRIRVQGRLDKSWTDRMSGMSISADRTAKKGLVTILVGHLADQAALAF